MCIHIIKQIIMLITHFSLSDSLQAQDTYLRLFRMSECDSANKFIHNNKTLHQSDSIMNTKYSMSRGSRITKLILALQSRTNLAQWRLTRK